VIAAFRPRRALLALGALVTFVPSAHAATFEQISRASGAQGLSSIQAWSIAGFVGDTGFVGGFTRVGLTSGFAPDLHAYVRNAVTNQTKAVGGTAGQIIAVDRTQTTGLFGRVGDGSSAEGGGLNLSVVPLTGGGSGKVVARLSEFGPQSAAFSGDGSTVVVADGGGVRSINVATGASTTLSTTFLELSQYSVSDDGTVVAAVDRHLDASGTPTGAPTGVLFRSGQRTESAGVPSISPDGSTLVSSVAPATGGGAPTIVTKTLASGTTKTAAVPAIVGTAPGVIWVATDGSRVAVGDGSDAYPPVYNKPAQALTVATGAWATFGGSYATQLKANGSLGVNKAISRNGRFAALTFNSQVAIVSLTGSQLVTNATGAKLMSASSYLATGGVAGCGASATFTARFVRPANWVATPRRALITASADGAVVKSATLVASGTPDDQAGDTVDVTFPAGAATASIRISVIDGAGRGATETFTQPLSCSAS
jgi:hypothetical protein